MSRSHRHLHSAGRQARQAVHRRLRLQRPHHGTGACRERGRARMPYRARAQYRAREDPRTRVTRFTTSHRRVLIGTSGWTYDGWRGPFYPKEVPRREWLSYYASQFCTTEINSSFYRTPALETVVTWRNSTPPKFAFAWKASKFVTHWKRLATNCK